MISENDTLLLKQIKTTNPEIYSLIERLQRSPTVTMSKFSHSMKNIISIISSSLQFIESQHPETTSYNLWPQLKDSTTYLVRFMDKEALYRDSAYIEAKPMNLLDLLWSIPDIMDDIYESDPNNSIRNYNYDIASNIPEIKGDYCKLKYAFIEIIKNAYEATSDNDTITISARIVGDLIAITIKDKGIGLDKDITNDVIEPYFTTKSEHTGTGLSIATRIARAHSGNLTISFEEYTCVTITLPL